MDIRKTSTSLLLALALSGIQAPLATSAAIAQETAPNEALTCEALEQQALVLSASPDAANIQNRNFAAVVNTIQDHFSKCGDRPVKAVIKLTTGVYELPNHFGFHTPNGELTIEPADGAQQVTLSLSDDREAMLVESINLNIKNVAFSYKKDLFSLNGSLTLDGVQLNGDGGVAVKPSASAGASSHITFKNVIATNSALVDLMGRPAQVTINRAEVSLDQPLGRPVVNLPATALAIDGGIGPVSVSGLHVLNTLVTNTQPALHIARPDVTVSTLTHSDQTPGSVSVEVANPIAGHHPLANVHITRSKFAVDHALREVAANANTTAIPGQAAVRFTYNIIAPVTVGQPGNTTMQRPRVLQNDLTRSAKQAFDASCNYWGDDLRVREHVKAEGTDRILETATSTECVNRPPLTRIDELAKPIPRDPQTNPGGSGAAPSNPDTRIQNEEGRISGPTRIETSVAASQDLYPKGADTVILARADLAADSVSAIPLAQELRAPVLLTMREGLHPSVAEEIKRLMPKGGRVILMGGDQALSPKVAEAVTKAGGKVERIAGANRAATAVATATQLQAMGKATQVLLADGNDWQPDLIAGPVAAKVDGVTLLTAGDKVAPESAAFLKANANLKVTALGEGAAKSGAGNTIITGKDGADLSLKVAMTFFKDPTAVGFATTADFADPLVGGNHIAHHQGPLLLVDKTADEAVIEWAKGTKTIHDVFIYGGDARISKAEADRLNTIKQAKPAS